jgi:hypothetical protein
MKLWLFCLMLGVLPGFGKDRPQEAVPITLYTKFEQTTSPEVVAAMREEVANIMEPIGIAFELRNLADATGSEVSVELAVITFKGACTTSALSPHTRGNPGALGWTHVSDGVILPFSEVDCDRIRTFMQRELLGREPAVRSMLFGRALGRVLAHELYHIFANTSHHGSCGVGKSAYSVQELISDDFRFQDKETEILRARTHTDGGLAFTQGGTY